MSRLGGNLALASALAALGVAAACGGGDDAPAQQPAPPAPPVVLDAGVAPNALCPDGKAVDWPPGPYGYKILQTLPPDIAFDGPEGTVALKDYFDPCATQSKLVVIRTSAAWCGTCIWSATHTKRLLDDARFGGRLMLIDLLIGDEDNMPAKPPDAARWKTKIDFPGKIAVDPKYTFAPALISLSPLPEYVLIDTRTMQVRNGIAPSSPEDLQNLIVLELAQLDKLPRPQEAVPKLADSLFTEDMMDMLHDMRLPAGGPPPDPTNAKGDDPAAAAFGKSLFDDTLLTPSGVSCSKCHSEADHFTDGIPQSVGVATVDRNSPDIQLAAWGRWQFWDGRADTLWMQALGPPENPKEMAGSRLYIVHQIKARYQTTYEAIFGALPANLDTLPADGKPGDAQYDALSQADKDAVTRVYVNAGKSIAAFERSLRVKPNALDAYIDGDLTALVPLEKKALHHFFVSGCPQCHWGPRLTDDAFHVIRMPTGRQDGAPDRGRIDVLAGLAAAEFNAASKWSDSPASAKNLVFDPNAAPNMLGAFKTPPLRGAAQTAPFGHGGKLAGTIDVSKHYGTRASLVGDDKAVGTIEPWIPIFDSNVQTELPPILDLLSANPVTP
jgi:cytochrome c peroxidase